MPGKLYLVPTPIGNIDDITVRAQKVLNDVDLVACEDTRHSGQLLSRLNIKKKLTSYHEYNEREQAVQIVKLIEEGSSVAVISDAGSPGISDPGYRVVKAAIEKNIQIVPLPGANSIIPALSASGLPTDRFMFEGYLNHKTAARLKRLRQLKNFAHTIVFFESPFRIGKCLENMLEVLGNRDACVAREVTKVHEEFIRGKLEKLVVTVNSRKLKGEIVILVAGADLITESNSETND
jgi:16S rRNA (cytidine1402-2'-O)-methyltransferase